MPVPRKKHPGPVRTTAHVTITLEQLEELVRSYNPGVETTPLADAYAFAAEAHAGQMRKSGELFVTHPLEVAGILAELHLDTASITAAATASRNAWSSTRCPSGVVT